MPQATSGDPSVLISTDGAIRSEADRILGEQGLLALLKRYGTPFVTGSYVLRLMAWRDLDIYLETNEISEAHFFELGGHIASALCPTKMSFRNERIAQTESLPRGLYWGIYLGNEREGDWKIDIWAVDPRQCKKLLESNKNLAKQLTPTARAKILSIKSQCWRDPEYRRSYSSMDIYRAVLDEEVGDLNEFREYLRHR